MKANQLKQIQPQDDCENSADFSILLSLSVCWMLIRIMQYLYW